MEGFSLLAIVAACMCKAKDKHAYKVEMPIGLELTDKEHAKLYGNNDKLVKEG